MKILFVSLLYFLSGISAVVAISVLLAGLFAFNSKETVVAIETLFGSLIAALLFGILSARLFVSANKRFHNPE